MSALQIKRLVSLPAVLEASTIYITKNEGNAAFVDLTFVGNNVADVRRLPSIADVSGAISTAIGSLTAAQIPDLPGSKIISDINVNTTGNAATATRAQSAAEADVAVKLKTPVTINGVSFDGSQPITVSAVDTATPRVAVADIGTTVAPLVDGKVPVGFLPTALDNIDSYPTEADFPATGRAETIYIAEDVNSMFRWTGTAYLAIPSGAANADIAVRLATPRNIGLTGDATGSALFDGTADAQITVTLASVGTAGEHGAFVTTDDKGRVVSSRAMTAADVPSLPGSKINSAISVDTTGNAATASKLKTAVNVTLQGDVAGTASFDGSGDLVITTVAAPNGGISGAGLTKVTVANGIVTGSEALVAADIPNLPGSKIISTLSVDTTGNAATATRADSAATADSLTIVAEW